MTTNSDSLKWFLTPVILCAVIPARAQTDPPECERRFLGQRVISANADNARAVFAADIDSDGDVDVLSASSDDDKIAWYENVDGLGTFGPQRIITTNADFALSVHAGDLDNDGDTDVLSASFYDNKIAWYENVDGLGTFGPQRVIATNASGARSVFAADVDGDGDGDVLAAAGGANKLVWHENTDGLGTFGPQRFITTVADGASAVFASDVDGDGSVDVLSASAIDDKIAWYRNIDGLGGFGPQHVITTNADVAVSVFAADMDGDSDVDVLSASLEDNKVAWYENVDGLGTFGPQHVISASANRASSVFAADVDGDGDVDVLSALAGDDEVVWYENVDGLGTFGPEGVITMIANGANSVFAIDIDGDGDHDVLSTSIADDKIAWYENEIDCNGNGVNDGCDFADGTSFDCNVNTRPDECDMADGVSADCDGNLIPDECEPGCNDNGRPDVCDLADGTSDDCNLNSVPDECEHDCNGNGTPDDCDVAAGATDDNANDVPDECEIPPTIGDDVCWDVLQSTGQQCSTQAECTIGACGLKSRYITITPPPGIDVAIKVTVIEMPLAPARVGESWWAETENEIHNAPLPSLRGAQLNCVTSPHSQVWSDGFLHLYGLVVVPGSRYEVRTCQSDGSACTAALVVETSKWVDLIAPHYPSNPNQPNFLDIQAILDKFKALPTSVDLVRVDLGSAGSPGVNRVTDYGDISMAVDAFKGDPYPFTVGSCLP